jgi:pimeloyl-ACP methyl ester carboxylesterase
VHARYDEGDGPPVVLLHGQPGSASDWVRVVPLLRERGLRAVAVDRPGYAGSGSPPADWGGNADALLALLDRLDLPAALLAGWSWGGGVALEAALRAPDRVTGLVLLGSVGHRLAVGPADRLLALPGVRAGIAPLMRRLGPVGVPLLRVTSGSALDPVALRYFAAEARVWPATGAWEAAAVEQVAMVRDAAALSASLPRVRVPAVVVHGWHDQYVAIRAGAALAAALPDARLVPLDAGHLLPFECPGAVADAVAAALKWPA